MRACWFLILAAIPFPALAASSQPKTASPADVQFGALHRAVSASFWRAENALQSRFDGGESRRALFSQLAENDPQREEYSRAAVAADEFVKLADENKIAVAPVMLYLGGLAKYSHGDDAGALLLLERLLREYPDYKRNFYYSDRDEPDPKYAVPVAAGISKLIFFLRLQIALKATPDAFASVQQITTDAVTTLGAQREYSWRLASFSDKYNRREFDENIFGSQPDQRRAGVLPSTLSLLNEAWDKLLPQAAQKAGSKALRAWLQTLAGPGHPLQAIAALRLNELETLLAGNLRKDAAAALAAKQWERAKTLLAQIKAEYSESAALSAFASSGLEQVTQGFKDEADGAFDMRALKPQTAALASYQKLFENADSPALKGYAQFRNADALGTMGQYAEGIARLQQAIAIWNALPIQERPLPDGNYDAPRAAWGAMSSYYIEDACYYVGFYYGAGLKERDKGIASHRDFLEKFPDSKYAPEALHDIMLWYRWSKRHKEAAGVAQELVARFPNSTRAANARDLLKTEYSKF